MTGLSGSSPIGSFGKVPAAGDFVSVGSGSAVTQAFQGWLQQENDYLASKKRPFPTAPIRFVYRDPAGAALVGALGPSRDTVGRTFPLSIYTHIDTHTAMPRFSALPTAFDAFLDGAAQTLTDAASMDLPTLAARIGGLHLPGAGELRDAALWTHEALGATPGTLLLEHLFGPVAQGVHYHGLNMMRTACAQCHGRDPGNAGIIVECHAGDDVQIAFWLCLAESLLGWNAAPPSFFWTDVSSEDSRLLLCLGAPPLGLLHYLADPSAAADRLWPTRTTSAAAIEAGRNALGSTQRQALEPPAPTAAGLLSALVQP
ncbi:MAG: type VI secretion system-associated protein TagF [Nannocystales bacterium]